MPHHIIRVLVSTRNQRTSQSNSSKAGLPSLPMWNPGENTQHLSTAHRVWLLQRFFKHLLPAYGPVACWGRLWLTWASSLRPQFTCPTIEDLNSVAKKNTKTPPRNLQGMFLLHLYNGLFKFKSNLVYNNFI